MIAPNEVEKGLVLNIEGEPYLVLERQHESEAGRAKVRMKLRHLRTRAIIERTVAEGQKLTIAPVERRSVTFMYWDGAFYHFKDPSVQDPDTPDELLFPPESLLQASKYIVDRLQLDLLSFNAHPAATAFADSVLLRDKRP